MAETATQEPSSAVEGQATAAQISQAATPRLSDRAMDAYLDTSRAEQAARRAKSEAMAPKIDEALAGFEARERMIAENPPPAVPRIQPPPDRSNIRGFLQPDDNESPLASIAKFIQGASLFGTALGGRGKAGSVATLAAFTGALEGWRKGDKDRAETLFSDWKAKKDAMLEQYDRDRTAYNDWITLSGASLDARLKSLQLQATKFDDPIMAAAAAKNDLGEVLKVIERRENHADQVKHWSEQIEVSRNNAKQAQLRAEEQSRQFRESMAQSDKHFQIRMKEIEKEHRERMDMRREMWEQKPATGIYFNRKTGEPENITQGQLRDDPETFHKVSPTDHTRWQQITIAQPMIRQLNLLVPKLLAEQPAQNLVKALELSAQGKLASNPDLRQFQTLAEEVNVKLTSVMGPGQFRVTLFNVLRDVGLKKTDTVATAKRLLHNWEISIDNDMRAIAGQPMREHALGPARFKVRDRAGAEAFIELGKDESLPVGYIVLEEFPTVGRK